MIIEILRLFLWNVINALVAKLQSCPWIGEMNILPYKKIRLQV